MGLRTRIRDLERVVRPAPEPTFEFLDDTARALDELFRTMAPEHVAVIEEDLVAKGCGFLTHDGLLSIRGDSKPTRLTNVAVEMVIAKVRGKFLGRFALPPAVAQVYLDHPDALPLHACQECRLDIPVRPGMTQPAIPVLTFFDACPLCGGEVGYMRPWVPKWTPPRDA